MSEQEAAEAARAFPDVPLLFNWAEGGKTPPLSLDRLGQLGYRIVIFPISTLLAATAAMRRILREIAQAGTPAAALPELPSFGEFCDFIGLPDVRAAEQRYAAMRSAAAASWLSPLSPPRRAAGQAAARRQHGHQRRVRGQDLQPQAAQARAGLEAA